MTSDIEPTGPRDLEVAAVENEQHVTELIRACVRATVVSVPLAIGLFVALVALGLHGQSPNWAAYLAMAAGIGILAGVFFGVLAGFVRTAHLFDD